MISAIQNNYYQSKQNIKLQKGQKQAFKGGFSQSVKDATTWGIKHIENGGVLVDFLFVDMIGMVIPRTYQAFQRNKEELGHINYKSGVEELIREIFSGPSMFVIPMAFIALSKKAFGPASNSQFKALDSMTDSFGRVVKNSKKPSDKGQLKKDFYKNIFSEIFEPHRKIETDKKLNIDDGINKIVEHLAQAETSKKSKEHIGAIKEIVSDLNKAHGIHLDNSHNVTLKDGLNKEVGALAGDLMNYSKDIVSKIADTAQKGATTETLGDKLKNLHKNKTLARRGILVATFLSTVGFLYSIPIMYKRNTQFPGIDGLVDDGKSHKDEKFSLSDIKGDKHANKVEAKKREQAEKQEQIAFGSSTGGTDKFFKKFDFNGHSVPHAILGIYTLGIMLGARLYQARNADERREVATRDFSGLSTITFALPILRNFISTGGRKSTGFPLAKTLKSVKNHFNPTIRQFSFENITDMYSGPSKLRRGLVDFAENISNQGGDLRKIFNHLSDNSKTALNNLSKAFSNKNTAVESKGSKGAVKLVLPEDNKGIIELFKKAQNDDAQKDSLKIITKELDDKKNPLVKKAESLKSIPEAISIVGISGFLGWFLPWFNINYTRDLYKGKRAHKQAHKQTLQLKELQPQK